MRNLKTFIIPALIAAAFPGTAMAADRATDSFVTRMQGEAAWDGVELNRITWSARQVRAYGVDRYGSKVVIQRTCGQDRIVCPTIQVADEAPKDARPVADAIVGTQ